MIRVRHTRRSTYTDVLCVVRAQAYEAEGAAGRVVTPLAGASLSAGLAGRLLAELRSIDWATTIRERASVRAEGYVTLQRPAAAAAAADGGEGGAEPPPKKRSKKVRAHPSPLAYS